MFLKFKNTMYKIHLPFSEACGGILGSVRLIISKWFKKRNHIQQCLGLSLFHSEVLCKASTKSMSVENQHRLDVLWSAMIKVSDV